MSLENLQNLSKLKKICVHNFFLSGCTHILFEKKLRTHISFEFGESLEVLQTHFFLSFQKKQFFEKTSSKDFFVSLERVWSEFGESLENLQTHSKLTKKSLLDDIFQKK